MAEGSGEMGEKSGIAANCCGIEVGFCGFEMCEYDTIGEICSADWSLGGLTVVGYECLAELLGLGVVAVREGKSDVNSVRSHGAPICLVSRRNGARIHSP